MSTIYNIVLQGASLIATADSTANVNVVDVVGNKEDVANRTADEASLMGLLRQVDADVTLIATAVGASSTVTGTADSGTTATLVDAALTQADDYFNGMVLIMTSGSNVGLARTIYDFVAGTDTVYVEPAFPAAIAITDTYIILPRNDFADILLGYNSADNAADTTLVVANANGSVLERLEYIQVDSATIITAVGTTIPALIGTPVADLATDIAAVKTEVDKIGTPVADVSTDIAAIKTVVDAVEVDTTSIETKVDTVDGIVDAIKLITDTLPDAGALTSLAQDLTVAKEATLGVPTGASLSVDIAALSTLLGVPAVSVGADIIAMQVDVTAIALDTSTTIPGLIGTPVATLATDIAGVQADVTSILLDTNTTIPALLGTPAVDLATDIAAINTLIGATVLGTVTADIQALDTKLGTPAGADVSTDIAAIVTQIGAPVGADISADIAAVQTVVDNIEDLLDGTTGTATALRREIGKMQVFEKGITQAANAGVTVLGTVTTRPVLIKSVTLYSQGATSGDLTSAAIKGGTAQATIFITDVQAAKVNIDADSEQVYTAGAWYLPAGATVVVDLQGTGATAVDLVAVFTYEAVLDGGYIA
jgi:hypothetical protein